jgi:hypothetical protein
LPVGSANLLIASAVVAPTIASRTAPAGLGLIAAGLGQAVLSL